MAADYGAAVATGEWVGDLDGALGAVKQYRFGRRMGGWVSLFWHRSLQIAFAAACPRKLENPQVRKLEKSN